MAEHYYCEHCGSYHCKTIAELEAACRCSGCEGRGQVLEQNELHGSDRVMPCDQCEAGKRIAALESALQEVSQERDFRVRCNDYIHGVVDKALGKGTDG